MKNPILQREGHIHSQFNNSSLSEASTWTSSNQTSIHAMYTGGSMWSLGVSMDPPSSKKKKINIEFFFIVWVCIFVIILIDGHSYLKCLDPPLPCAALTQNGT